jgi:hypothetical protein
MKIHDVRRARTTFLAAVMLALFIGAISTAFAQGTGQVYTATMIASEGVAGSSGRVSIRIDSLTTDADKAKLLAAFKKSPADGNALLRTMSSGFINVDGQPGRKIQAVFARQRQDGRDLIIIGDHMASKLEQWKDSDPKGYPFAVMHLRFGDDGSVISGEAFPSVKLAVTPDGYVDVETGGTNQVTLINISRQR